MSEVSEVSELASDALIEDLRLIVGMANAVSYTHLTLPTSDLV